MWFTKVKTLVLGAFLTGSFFALYLAAPSLTSITYDGVLTSGETRIITDNGPDAAAEAVFTAAHIPTPEPVRGIYMTACVAGSTTFRDKLVNLVKETELNTIVIDIKDYSGTISFQTNNPVLRDVRGPACRAADMREFIAALHDSGIYVVGRITVFQDPYYSQAYPELAVKKESDKNAAWKDYKGISYIDIGARDFWEYILELSLESYAIGFDEINYDYIRFPSDGNMKDIYYPWSEQDILANPDSGKAKLIQQFAEFLYENLSKTGVVLSADLFGYTTTNTDDLGIGQVLERVLPYFDYVMPMVYPSHYNSGFIGIARPAASPYEVVNYSMKRAVQRARALEDSVGDTSTTTEAMYLKGLATSGHGSTSPAQLRPWLQDFDLGATYTPEMVRAQIQATYDAGLTSWVLWDAGNTYTRAALHPPQ